MDKSCVDETERRQRLTMYDFDAYSRQPVSFYFCQSGFACSAHKPVIVWTNEVHAEGAASLRSKDGHALGQVPLSNRGINLWGRQEWLADLSAVTTPGEYQVVVNFGAVEAVSPIMAIRAECYTRLMEKAAKHYHLKQCGIVCHSHDAYEYSLSAESLGKIIRHVSAWGGWHDAHDDNKWACFVWGALYGLLKTQERVSPRWVSTDERPYCLAEAQWEIEWLLRMQKADGSFYYGVWEWSPRVEGDHVRLPVWGPDPYDDCCDDRRAVVDCWGQDAANRLIGTTTVKVPSTAPKIMAYLAHNLMHFARLTKGLSAFENVAARCLDGANRAMAYVSGLNAIPDYQVLEVDAALALCLIERYRLLGCEEDLRDAEARIQRILALQQPEGHFHASEHCRGLEFYPDEAGDDRPCFFYPFGYMMALIEYLDGIRTAAYPCHLAQPVSEALGRFAGLLAALCRTTGFQQMVEPCVGRDPAVIVPFSQTGHGYNVLILTTGVVLAAAGRLLANLKWTRLAERQLYWVLGANPRFMSFMNDEGVRNSGSYNAGGVLNSEGVFNMSAYYRHVRDMRWGITTGIFEGKTPNYPMAGRSAESKYDCKAQETWLNPTGWFLRLLAELASG